MVNVHFYITGQVKAKRRWRWIHEVMVGKGGRVGRVGRCSRVGVVRDCVHVLHLKGVSRQTAKLPFMIR